MPHLGSGVAIPPVGAKVRHPLWPELGVGEVKSTSKIDRRVGATYATGCVRWSCGQVSIHNLSVLREVEG